MAAADPGSLSQFLNYGGLGLLAILCIVVLGYNVWSLNGLVAKADPERLKAARPLLLGQMGISLIGLLAVGIGGIYLDQVKAEGSRKQMAQIVVDPWERRLGADLLPIIDIAGRRSTDRLTTVECTPGQPTNVMIDMEPFIRHRVSTSLEAQRALLPIAAAAGGER